jgi:predicted Fe-S protein YdhL (DUF1289 family)
MMSDAMNLTDAAIQTIASQARAVSANAENDAWLVPSPCISTCIMDEDTGLCQGCLRTLDEIRLWGNADADDKRQIWDNITQRLSQVTS